MSDERFPRLEVRLPAWVESMLPSESHRYASDEEKMRLALDLARENIRRGDGGPFGAAIFDAGTGVLVAAGVNLVVPMRWSSAHAEMVAFAMAHRRLATHDLGAPGMPLVELFTSTEPCAMCLGATLWSGVRRVVCAARGEDAEAIGFDEGPKPADWAGELQRRGIEVVRDLMRDEGRAILEEYRDRGGPLYNGRAADGASG